MLKRLLRWLLRTVVILFVLFVIVAVSEYVSHRYSPGSVLTLRLNGPVVERGDLSLFGFLQPHQVPLNLVREALKKGEKDPKIVGLAITVIDPHMELAQAQELSAMITDFAKHGKWTTAYMESAGESGYGNLPYMVASAAQQVSMMPQGEMNLLGVSLRELFARGMLDKLKITPNFAAIGKYKDAANIFTDTDFTPAQREEDESMIHNIYTQLVDETAKHRHLTPATMTALINQAPLTAEQGLQDKLLDRLEFEDQFDKRVKDYRGEHHELISYKSYVHPSVLPFFGPHDKIAIVYGLGAIQHGQGGYDPILSPGGQAMGSDEISAALRQARKDPSIRAVVFRIDSPGGDVIASELIRRQAVLLAARKPLVVSMSGYDASGGYWISTPAAKIFADPGTITGSIGVLGGKFNIAGAATAIGVNTGAISIGTNADMFDSFTDFTPAQAAIFKDQILGKTYQHFLQIVAKARHMTVAQVNAIAQGRVWTGEQALKNGLVDQLGGMSAAIREAKVLAKIGPKTPVQLVELPTAPGFLGRLFGSQVLGSAKADWIPPELKPLAWLIKVSLVHHDLIGEVYCPVRLII